MVSDDVVTMVISHVNEVKVAATEEVAEVAFSALNRRFPINMSGKYNNSTWEVSPRKTEI